MSPWKVILATMVIFGSGVITGAFLLKMELPQAPVVDSHFNSTTNAPTPVWAAQIQRLEFLRRIQKQLNLTPAQHDEIARIMKESLDRSRPLWHQIEPQMREEVRRVHQEIRQVLNPEQQVKFEELLKPRRKTDANGRPVRGGQEQTNPSQPSSLTDAAVQQ